MYQALFSSPLSGGESKKRTGYEASSIDTIIIVSMLAACIAIASHRYYGICELASLLACLRCDELVLYCTVREPLIA